VNLLFHMAPFCFHSLFLIEWNLDPLFVLLCNLNKSTMVFFFLVEEASFLSYLSSTFVF
jgi:hypothetical protein